MNIIPHESMVSIMNFVSFMDDSISYYCVLLENYKHI
jgi:hypothetical protein